MAASPVIGGEYPWAFACATDRSEGVERSGGIESTVCGPGGQYTLRYDVYSRTISVRDSSGWPVELEEVAHGLDPEFVGAATAIRFLPPRLQPYLNRSKLLYISALRSSAGDGGGQCGSGVEKYLNVLDVGGRPRRTARVLITSCEQEIELAGMEMAGPDDLAGFAVHEDRLQVSFLSYGPREGSPVAMLSEDLLRLEFAQDPRSSSE
jgi:hypothetical protein